MTASRDSAAASVAASPTATPILRASRTPRSSSRARDPVREIRVDAFLPAVGFLEPLEELSTRGGRTVGRLARVGPVQICTPSLGGQWLTGRAR